MLKKNVLRNEYNFSKVYKKGKSQGSRFVVIFTLKNNLGYNRIGFLASKKVGNSVKRNRARRLMKESFRKIENKILKGYDYIFIARNTINGVKCEEVEKSMYLVLKRAKMFK